MNSIRTYQVTYFYQSDWRGLDGVRGIDNLRDLEVHSSDCLICICLWTYGGRDMGTASVPPVWQLLFKERSWNPHLHVPFTLWWTVDHKTARIIVSVQKCSPNLLRATQINLEFRICMHFFYLVEVSILVYVIHLISLFLKPDEQNIELSSQNSGQTGFEWSYINFWDTALIWHHGKSNPHTMMSHSQLHRLLCSSIYDTLFLILKATFHFAYVQHHWFSFHFSPFFPFLVSHFTVLFHT